MSFWKSATRELYTAACSRETKEKDMCETEGPRRNVVNSQDETYVSEFAEETCDVSSKQTEKWLR